MTRRAPSSGALAVLGAFLLVTTPPVAAVAAGPCPHHRPPALHQAAAGHAEAYAAGHHHDGRGVPGAAPALSSPRSPSAPGEPCTCCAGLCCGAAGIEPRPALAASSVPWVGSGRPQSPSPEPTGPGARPTALILPYPNPPPAG